VSERERDIQQMCEAAKILSRIRDMLTINRRLEIKINNEQQQQHKYIYINLLATHTHTDTHRSDLIQLIFCCCCCCCYEKSIGRFQNS
jgi:hypothetical protein